MYQVVQHPYVNRSFENIAIAVADSPDGPFVKSKAPILEPTKDGIWDGEEDNRFAVKKKGSFDSHKVHDPFYSRLKASSICITKESQWVRNCIWADEKQNGELQ